TSRFCTFLYQKGSKVATIDNMAQIAHASQFVDGITIMTLPYAIHIRERLVAYHPLVQQTINELNQ
ncbi:unnamed protein product, partial [Arabidopsis halleri]